MSASALLFVSALVASFAPLEATEFLGSEQQAEAVANVAKQVVHETLLKQSPSSDKGDRFAALVEQLRPAYAALPKNEHSQLEPSTARYVLHRHFVHKYGWYVKGLDPEGSGWNSSSLTAPRDGLDLAGLAAFAAALEDVIFQDSLGGLRNVYKKLELATSEVVSGDQFELAMRAYLSGLITGDYGKFEGQADVPALEAQAKDFYPEYDDIVKWFRNLYLSRNLLVLNEGVTFERAGDFLREVLHHFGTLPEAECRTLKKDLVKMEEQSGRVLLSDFYGNVKLQFHESLDYLRNLGVVEGEEGTPRLIIPNYVTAPSRCMEFSNYYSVCCPDECDGLMVSLEHSIGHPSAEPTRIAELISALPSDTVSAPRELSSLLLARLNEIAHLHGGRVPLHGRLFMQWMHHAYPRECPYPHVAGTTKPVTQDEWLRMHEHLNDAMATPQEQALRARTNPQVKSVDMKDIPWSGVEELVAVHKQGPGHTGEYIRIVVCMTALLFFAFPLMHLSRAFRTFRKHPKAETIGVCTLVIV